MMKIVAICFALVSVGCGLWAARFWHRASQVQIVPSWIHTSHPKPADDEQAKAQWIAAVLHAARGANALIQRAAIWTAFAIGFGTAATLFGNL